MISKTWVGPSCSNAALESYVRIVHAMFMLLHGPVEKLLEQVCVHMHVCVQLHRTTFARLSGFRAVYD